ncbi:MAG: SIS domain-containing protein [Elusimicrobia bacterium]|nr:SIS domain-containing protein [Elusimicrobiota bacterium]
MESVEAEAKKYWSELKSCADKIDLAALEKIVRLFQETYAQGGNVYVMGNGGSATTASHLACDLNKTASSPGKKRFKVVALNDNIPVMLAIGNDIHFEQIFAEQLRNFLTSQDALLFLSGSGNSPNVLKAAELARALGSKTAAFLGFRGGRLKALVDYPLVIESDHYGIIEDLHLSLCHFLTFYFKKAIAQQP